MPGLYAFLAGERALRRGGVGWVRRKLYDEPLFRRLCRRCGAGICLFDGIPSVWGGLEIYIGNGVVMHGTSTLVGAKVFDHPKLIIGDRSHCGSQFSVAVGADVTIGSDVLIANRVSLLAYDSHPMEAGARRRGEPAPASSSHPIIIGDDAWICVGAMVMKGVTVGAGAIVAAGAIVVDDVPPGCVVGGNPARILRRPSGAPQRRRKVWV
ncbi:MAG: acyltransferase [Acidiferrobacter sp.]